MQLDRLSLRQRVEGYWMTDDDGDEKTGIRATALATLAFQRLGDDRYHDAIGRAVAWLLDRCQPDTGAWPRFEGDGDARTEERGVGKEWVGRGGSRWVPVH